MYRFHIVGTRVTRTDTEVGTELLGIVSIQSHYEREVLVDHAEPVEQRPAMPIRCSFVYNECKSVEGRKGITEVDDNRGLSCMRARSIAHHDRSVNELLFVR